MTVEHILVLAILLVAVVLFVSEWVRVDLVALLVLVTLALTAFVLPEPLVTAEQALSGFSNAAVITVIAVFIMSGGLFQTGVADSLSRRFLRLAGRDPVRLTLFIMLAAGLMSAVMNNIGAVAILMPAVVGIARQTKIPASKLLMPLAFAALLGGNITLIGTPPNLLASDILSQYGGLEPFGFFDFAPMGLIVTVLGIAYMVIFGRNLLPERTPTTGDIESIKPYTSEFIVSEESSLVGKTIPETRMLDIDGVEVMHLHDGKMEHDVKRRRIEKSDVLTLQGPPRNIVAASQTWKLTPTIWDYDQFRADLREADKEVVEVTLAPDSALQGITLKEDQFRARYGMTVLAMRHHGQAYVTRLGKVPLAFGDSFLVEGTGKQIDLLRTDDNFLILDTPPIETRRLDKAPIAIAILVITLLAASFLNFNVAIIFLTGAALMVLSGAVTMDEAYRAVDWRSVFLIAGMLPLGIAMAETGTAALLADQLIRAMGGMGPMPVLIGIFLLTTVLTAVMSNAAATVLIVPIAIDAAFNLGVKPEPFVMATILAASNSFVLPVGHQVNIIILGAGGYKVIDYVKVGVWLNVIMLVLIIFVLPIVWPF